MGQKKAKIIKAAEALIAERGIADTTIAKVARKAQVADSLVYKHFKNKEDLLFSIANMRMEEALNEFHEALQGIRDPMSCLSKIVWHGLRYNDLHPGYVRILLFDCRSNSNFYRSYGYELLRKHSRITTNILEDGVRQGVFRRDLNTGLVRDIIYGIFDLEAISCLATGEIKRSIDDFEDIMALLMPMVCASEQDFDIPAREKILLAAEKTFARSGFNKSNISDVAALAQTGEGSIYDYFKNKEDLMLSIPVKRLQEHLDQLPEVFQVTSPLRKLRRLLRYHFTLYLPNRDFLTIFLLDNQLNMRFYSSEAYRIFQRYMKVIEEVVEEGKTAGALRKDVNSRVFRNMFLGAFTHMALRWVIFGDSKTYDKMAEIDQLMDLLSYSIV